MNTEAETAQPKEDWQIKKDERRTRLIELSDKAREFRESQGLDCTLNEIIIENGAQCYWYNIKANLKF